MNTKKILTYYVLPLLILLLTAALLHNKIKNIEENPTMVMAPWAVDTDVVVLSIEDQGFPALGKVVSSSEVRIVPRISGTILKMGPREGALVEKDDLLVQLDTRELEAMAASLKEKLVSAVAVEENSLTELKRNQKLLLKSDTSISIVDQLETTYRANQANVRSLRQQLNSEKVKISYGHIIAPISGRVANRAAEPGDTIFPGNPVYTLNAVEGGRVIVPVPLSTLTRISTGGKVQLSLGARKQEATITRINPSLDALSMGSFEIDLTSRPFDLPSGAPISARVVTAEAGPGLSVAIDSLRPSQQANERSLFKVNESDNPHIQLIKVQIQLCGEQRCIVDGNLQEGDRVVTAHSSVLLKLHDGDRVLNSWSEPLSEPL